MYKRYRVLVSLILIILFLLRSSSKIATVTPIFPENKEQAKGQLARTTYDQYGESLHINTIKNALG